MSAVAHLSVEHMTNAAREAQRLATMSGNQELAATAARMQRRAIAMREGATVKELVTAGDGLLRALVGKEAA